MIKNYSYYETEAGYKIDGKTNQDIVMAGGGTKSLSDFALSTDLTGYVTTNIVQDIPVRKVFVGGTDNEYTGATMEIRGNGTTIFPTLSFHQPSIIAGVISLRPEGFNFMNPNGIGFENVKALGFYKSGSNNNEILLGDGSVTYKNAFIFGSNWSGTIEAHSPDLGLPTTNFKPSKSGFYRPNNENDYGSLLMWVSHTATTNEYGAGIAFGYGGLEAYLTGTDSAGNKTPNKKIWTTGNFNPDSKVNKAGDTMTGALNIKSYSLVGIWKGFNNDTNYMIWRNHTDTKNIAYIGADGNSAASGGGGDGFAIVAPSGRLQLNAQDGVFINGATAWTNVNFNPDLYLTQRDLNNNSLVAETTYPNSVTYYAGDPATTYFQSYYGTSLHIKSNIGWYNRLDFPTNAEKLFLYQGINTTDMSFRGYIPVLNGNVTNWDSNNFNPASYVTQSSLIAQLGSYATLNGVQTFNNTITFNQSPVIPSGTLGSHAVNVLQLNTKINALDSATGVGFYLGDAESPYLQHVIHGSISLATKNYAQNLINNRVLSENNAVALGFVGATANTPYVKHANGTEIRVATEEWSSNNFITLHSPQNVTGQKTFTAPPKVPNAINIDEAVNLGQAQDTARELAQEQIDLLFVEVIYMDDPTDLTFDLNNYNNPRFSTIVCKGNNIGNIRIENMGKSTTVKIFNTSSINPIIYFEGGTIATGLGINTWAEFYRDKDGDIFKNNVNGTNIIN